MCWTERGYNCQMYTVTVDLLCFLSVLRCYGIYYNASPEARSVHVCSANKCQ